MGLGRWERIRMMAMKRERERKDLRTETISSLCSLCLCYLKSGLAFSMDILC